MLTTALLLVLCSVIKTAPIDEDKHIDLSYLGSSIFGAPSEKVGKSLEKWHKEHPQNPEEFGEYAEGDILFPHEGRNGLISKSTRWPGGVVPYEISPFYTSKDVAVIERAMAIYHKYTCIK